MNKKILCLIPLLILLTVPIVYAGTFKTSFLYLSFNQTTVTYKTLDAKLKNWQVKIENDLTWNATVAGSGIVRLHAYAGQCLDLAMGMSGQVDLWYYETETGQGVQIRPSITGVWEAEKPFRVTLYDGYLDIYASNKTKVLDNYVLGKFELDKIGVKGSVVSSFLGGYVNVEAGTSLDIGESIIEPIHSILPAIITIACIGALLGLVIKAMGKL